jgi:hypothetical protein
MNLGFTIFFGLEMMLKLIAVGLIEYFRDYMNIFDALLVAVSLVE